MKYLLSKGFKFHIDIYKTYSGTNKYYCKESNYIKEHLQRFRDVSISKS